MGQRRRFLKSVLSMVLSLIIVIGTIPISDMTERLYAGTVDNGTCGENLTWTLDDEGTLTISGTGEMENYPQWSRDAISRVVIEYGVTSISDHAFQDCVSLTSIIIPKSVTSIGKGAFLRCHGLTNIIIPSSVTSIDNSAFCYCGSLTSITIPNSVISIGDRAFEQCGNLTNITIPNSVTRIGDLSFYYCRGLMRITIPRSVASIGDYAFYECGYLSDVYYGGSESDWGSIVIDEYNECLTNATIHYNSTNSPNSASCKNPVWNTDGTVTWDCVWFGHYWQDDTNNDGKADKNDTKEPIKWRILSTTNDDLFLLSDKLLDVQVYNTEWSDITWEKSTIRSWLNGYGVVANNCGTDYSINNFLNSAFSAQEQVAIKNSSVDNSVSQGFYETDGGNDTVDKLFLLSYKDTINNYYGFSSVYWNKDPARSAKSSLFVKNVDVWWLRSPGLNSGYARVVKHDGDTGDISYGVGSYGVGVRPALHISPSSPFISYAGTVCSDGTENENATPGGDTGIAATGIKLSSTSFEMEKGDTAKLSYIIYPKNAKDKTVTWTSSNTLVATVSSDGKVSALAEGNAVITAVTRDGGFTASCSIRVVNSAPTISKLNFSGNTAEIPVDKDIPILGGETFSLDLPVGIPVNCVIEDGKIKVGINAKKKPLYSYNSTEGVTTTSKNKSFKEQFEDFKKDAMKADYIARDENWLKNVQDKQFKKYNIPGIKGDVKFDIIGYLEGTWSDHMDTLQGTLVLKLSGSATAQTQMVVVFVPVTMNCKFSASGKLIAALGYDFNKASWYGDLQLAAAVGIEPYAGIGVGQWLSIGVYGKAETEVTFTPLSSRRATGLDKWTISGEAGVKGYFAKKEGKWPIISGSHQIYPKKKTKTSSPLVGSGSGEFTEFENMESEPEMVLVGNSPSGVLSDNAYPAAKPMIVSAGGISVLLYVTDDKERAGGLNQTKLVYRIYDEASGSYGAPVAVLDDGTADFDPVVYTDGTDIYVAWLDSNKTFGNAEDPEIIDYMKTFGVRAAKFNPGSNNFTDLGRPSNSFHYTYSPVMYMSEGALNLAWVENEDDALYGMTERNVIKRYTYRNGAWTLADTISGLNAVTSLAAGNRGNGNEIAYAVDRDNNLETMEQTVFLKKAAGEPEKIDEGNISALSYTGLPSLDGTVLAMNCDGGLYYENSRILTPLLPDDTMGNASGFWTYENAVYYLSGEEESRNIAVSSYENGEWGSTMLTHEEGYVNFFSCPTGSISYLCAEAAYDETKEEWETACKIKALDALSYSDTELECVDFAPANAYPGMELPIDLYIKNNGTKSVTGAAVTVSYGGKEISKTAVSGNILPGETKVFPCSFSVPSTLSSGGDFKITAKTAGDDEANNDHQTIAIEKADLEVRSNCEKENGKLYLITEVENKGLKDSNAVTVVTDESGHKLFEETGLVKAGSTVIYRKEYAGDKGKVLTISTTGDVDEFYEMNNVTWQEMTTIYPWSVRVTGITLPESQTIKAGESVTLMPVITPSDAAEQTVSWTSSDEKIATVDKDGKVTGVDVGTADITAVTEDGGYKAVCRINVTSEEKDQEEDKKPGEDDIANIMQLEIESKGVPVGGETVTAKVMLTWLDAATYTGKKITPKSLMDAKADLSDVASKFTTKKKYTPLQLLKTTFVSSGKNAGKSSFYVKITLDEKKAKKAGLTKKRIKEIKALIKAVNDASKTYPCVYRIVPISLSDAKVTVKATWKKNGTIRKVKSVKVKAKVNGSSKTFTLKKSDYDIIVVDAKTKTVSITGKGNFDGTKETVTKK